MSAGAHPPRTERIGFIGLGSMGVGMAANLVGAGYPLTVMGHSRREPVERLLGLGAAEAATAGEVAAASDIVFICVTTSEVVEQLVLGEQGLLAGMQSPFLLIDCGTSNPQSTLMLQQRLAAKGCTMMDVPMGKSAAAAEAGTLNMMAGGSEADFERARPILACLSENLFHVGETGMGHKIKLMNNAYSMSVACLCAQVMKTAEAAGIDQKLLYDVMAAGPNRSDFFDWMMAAVTENDTGRLQFSLANGLKDVGYFNDLAGQLGVDCSVPQSAQAVLQAAAADGHGNASVPSLMHHI